MDTICAIATPQGKGAISIIRVSGNESINIVNDLFDHDLTKKKSHTISYGHIVFNGDVIDEVLVSVFRAPKTFTKEDVVEINCHGGIYATNKVLEALLSSGCQLASPGEFTKRAFLNGRIDLARAEAVMDVIEAEGKEALRLANYGLEGRISQMVNDIRKDILDVIANIEVNIDYPEYDDVLVVTEEILRPKTNKVIEKLNHILESAETGKIIRNGVSIAIIGSPNVGKSSLLNALLDEELAIVTNIAGTTRDTISGYMTIKGVGVKLIDTAGIRDATNQVEKIGVEKAKKVMKEADIIVLVFDNSRQLTASDYDLLSMTEDKKRIVVLNKIDIDDKNVIEGDDVVKISVLLNKGIDTLLDRLFHSIGLDLSNPSYLSNARHIAKAREALGSLNSVIDGLNQGLPIDMMEIDLKRAWETLGEIIGDTYTDSLIDELFSKFCLGK